MKFGFAHIPSEHFGRHVRLVRLAEALGFDYAWMPDQTFYRDTYVMLAACAAGTERIRLGVGVTNPYTRHPAVAARAIATVDEISGGRAVLGIGAGNNKELLAPLGIDQGRSAAKCREMLLIVRKMLAGEVVSFKGEEFTVDGAQLEFTARRDIPLYLAGRGPLILTAAGEVADGAIIGGLCSPSGLRYAFDLIGRGASKAGRGLQDLDIVSWVTVHLTDGTDGRHMVLDALRPVVGHLMGGAPDCVLETLGFSSAFVKELRAKYRAGGPKAVAPMVSDEAIDHFAVVGSVPECAARLSELERWGTTHVCVLMPPGTTDDHAALLEKFARGVMPHFR